MVTVHGLDFGIPAEKTGLQHLCLTTGELELGNEQKQRRAEQNQRSEKSQSTETTMGTTQYETR